MDFCPLQRNIDKSISKNLSVKYFQKLAKQFATNSIKTASKRAIQKLAEATSNLIGNKIADRIISIASWSNSNASLHTDEKLIEIPNEKWVSPEKRQGIINELTLIQCNDNGISKNNEYFR